MIAMYFLGGMSARHEIFPWPQLSALKKMVGGGGRWLQAVILSTTSNDSSTGIREGANSDALLMETTASTIAISGAQVLRKCRGPG
ncbi:hypothetical protein BBJ66_07410 [Rhizobium sp. RSm-3]|nr:hypothetical protein BBJ66_07410 [Rhizobium sp. RSm-3]